MCILPKLKNLLNGRFFSNIDINNEGNRKIGKVNGPAAMGDNNIIADVLNVEYRLSPEEIEKISLSEEEIYFLEILSEGSEINCIQDENGIFFSAYVYGSKSENMPVPIFKSLFRKRLINKISDSHYIPSDLGRMIIQKRDIELGDKK